MTLTDLLLLILPLFFVLGVVIFVRSMVVGGRIGDSKKNVLRIASVSLSLISLAISLTLLLKK